MAANLDLPWPQCLGSFDEESCRYFLHEIGTQMVPKYPFSFGIEEVYGGILERYGYDGTPDVTCLLQELLEDEQNATGFGDDGDVWRSWRHGWRHRNDDVRNPFIPRFGSLVLRPSALPRVRQIRAENFIRQPLAEMSKDEEPKNLSNTGSSKGRSSTIKRTSSPCKQDLISLNKPSYPDCAEPEDEEVCTRKSWNPIDTTNDVYSVYHVRDLLTIETDSTLSALFEMLETDKSSTSQLRGGERSLDHFRGDELEPNTAVAVVEEPGSLQPASDIAESGHLNLLVRSDEANEVQDPNEAGKPIQAVSKVGTLTERSQQMSSVDDARQTDTTDSIAKAITNPQSDQQRIATTPESKKRATNRQARLIDGTIFTTRSRRSKPVGQIQPSDTIASETASKRASTGLNWSPIQRRDSLRSNWTYDIRHLFHRSRKPKSNSGGHKHCSVPVPPKSTTSCISSSLSMAHHQHPSIPSHESPPQRVRAIWTDGADDYPPTKSSSVYLNKPLPMSPDDIVRSISSRSQLRSSQDSNYSANLPSAISTTSSTSRTSSRKEPRAYSRDLLQTDMLATHDLPPISEVDTNNKDAVDPRKSPAPPASPISYSSLAEGNPFIDNKSPVRPSPLDFSKPHRRNLAGAADTTHPNIWGIPAVDASQAKPSDCRFTSLPWSKPVVSEQSIEMSQLERGRSKNDTGPSNNASMKEAVPPKTPTKRSRSPFKRFLGITKSHSTNKLEDLEEPAPPVTPGGTSKDSLKKWGDRLRYGFLTPDREQLRQEELIEAHNNDSTTSTPQYSTFPVSLEPPMQAKVQSEIELIVTVTANRYLMREAKANRLSAESVAKTKELWEKMNRPQVIEFHYDQLTQHNLVMANLDRVKLYGDAAQDAIAINSTLRGWKIMAREMAVRTFCSPDSVIRKHLHDAHRVLELLGAPTVTFLAFEEMQLKAMAKITQRQAERVQRHAGSAGGRNFSSSSNNTFTMNIHRRNASEGSYAPRPNEKEYPITALQMDKISLSPSPTRTSTPFTGVKVRKATGANGAVMSLPTSLERSREVYAARLRDIKAGTTIKEI